MRARRASGVREGDLVRKAERLRQTVNPLLPKLTPDCPTDRFDRLRAELEEVRESREESRLLDRLGRWGEPIVRAYAGLLRFYLDPKVPEVLVASFPGGTVSYAPLGGAPKEAQIAVQQFDDPRRLMLGYLAWVRKGFHFFATDTTLYCSGRSEQPPPEFLSWQLARLPYRLSENAAAHRFDCSHLADGARQPYLAIEWTGAGTTMRVCPRCAKSDRQLLASLTENLAVPSPEDAFPVSASLNVRCESDPNCVHQRLPPLSRGLRKRYQYGRLSDAQLLTEYRAEVRPRVEAVRGPLFVAGGTCYGSDSAKFIDALKPSPAERRALEAVLPEQGTLFEVDPPTASQALERLWPTHAETIVLAIVQDEAQAQRLVKEARSAPGRVSELLRRAERATQEKAVLGALPRYQRLSPEAAYVDSIARSYRTQGESSAERLLLQSMPKEGKERGIAYGFLLALKRGGSHSWQFSESEKEFGTALLTRASDVLVAPPDRYHEALGSLLEAAGVPNWGTRASA